MLKSTSESFYYLEFTHTVGSFFFFFPLTKGVRNQVVTKAEPQHCALCVGPCCVLRVTAVRPNLKGKMLEPVLHIHTPVVLEWAYSLGKELNTCLIAGLVGVYSH